MKMTKSKLALFAFILILPFSTQAQNKIKHSVFSNGGSSTADGTNRLAGTLGQAAVGAASNQSNTARSGFWVQAIDLITSVEQVPTESIPGEFLLYQNYPNPFNPTTTIQFDLPQRSEVTLKLYDLLGREVTTFLNQSMQAGRHKVTFEAGRIPSGVYFYRLEASGFVRTRKLTLLK